MDIAIIFQVIVMMKLAVALTGTYLILAYSCRGITDLPYPHVPFKCFYSPWTFCIVINF